MPSSSNIPLGSVSVSCKTRNVFNHRVPKQREDNTESFSGNTIHSITQLIQAKMGMLISWHGGITKQGTENHNNDFTKSLSSISPVSNTVVNFYK